MTCTEMVDVSMHPLHSVSFVFSSLVFELSMYYEWRHKLKFVPNNAYSFKLSRVSLFSILASLNIWGELSSNAPSKRNRVSESRRVDTWFSVKKVVFFRFSRHDSVLVLKARVFFPRVINNVYEISLQLVHVGKGFVTVMKSVINGIVFYINTCRSWI